MWNCIHYVIISTNFVDIDFKVGLSPSKKNHFISFNKNALKIMKNAFHFILKFLFVLKIFKFLSWLFGHVDKRTLLDRLGSFRNLWRHNLEKKQLQYTLNTQCNSANRI